MKPPSDLELKHALVGDYKRNAERAGVTPDIGALESQVLADLAMVDQYDAEQASKPDPKPKERKPRDIRTNELEQELAEHNMRAYVDENPRERAKDIMADTRPKSPRAIAMFARIKQILTPRGSIAKAAASGKDMHDALVECNCPALAREFLELWSWYVPLRGLKSLKNPFYMMSDGDAARKFLRGLEDICDRSNGWAGTNWYTK